MEQQQLHYLMALSQIHKVGPVLARNLIAYCGGAEAVFKEKRGHLVKIPGIGQKLSESIRSFNDFDKVEKEIQYIQNQKIRCLTYLDDNYPRRLKDVASGPLILFAKGNMDLNASRMLAVVGTRKASEYGKNLCEKMIEELVPYGVTIVSGLAYGIDYVAHKSAIKSGLPTLGVLGHGLKMVYPAAHRTTANKMTENGGLLTEYFSDILPDAEHFPARNRIVAGITDGLVLVETAIKGGALITAELSNSYNREVFAFPGRINDEYSEGCNHFIKLNKAYLIESAADIAYMMGWDRQKNAPVTKKDVSGLNESEKKIYSILKESDKVDLDTLCSKLSISITDASIILLNLEFKGIIQALPAKYYRLA